MDTHAVDLLILILYIICETNEEKLDTFMIKLCISNNMVYKLINHICTQLVQMSGNFKEDF